MASQLADIRRHFETFAGSEYHSESIEKSHNILNLSSPIKRRTKALEDVENATSPKRSKVLHGTRIENFCKSTKFFRPESFSDKKDFYTSNSSGCRTSRAEVAFPTKHTSRSPIRHRTGNHSRYKSITKSPNSRPASKLMPGLSKRTIFSNLVLTPLQPSSILLDYNPLPIPSCQSKLQNKQLFKIHEDTDEELSKILLQHKSSAIDEEFENASTNDVKDSRDKENIPPAEEDYEIYSHSRHQTRNDGLTDMEIEPAKSHFVNFE